MFKFLNLTWGVGLGLTKSINTKPEAKTFRLLQIRPVGQTEATEFASLKNIFFFCLIFLLLIKNAADIIAFCVSPVFLPSVPTNASDPYVKL